MTDSTITEYTLHTGAVYSFSVSKLYFILIKYFLFLYFLPKSEDKSPLNNSRLTIYIININPQQSPGIELLTRRERENPRKGVYSVSLFAVYNLCVNLSYFNVFVS